LLVTEDGEAISDFKAILRWLDEHYPENDETEPHREQIRSHGLEPTRPSR
jgi:glutathione S-transferase